MQLCSMRVAVAGFTGPQGCSLSTSIVLVCAVLASLAAGVLLAYGVCQAMFALFHSQVRKAAEAKPRATIVATPAIES